IVLDGTTLDELENVHVRTLNLCVNQTNEAHALVVERERAEAREAEDERQRFQRDVEEAAARIKFEAPGELVIEEVAQTGWAKSDPNRTVNLSTTFRNGSDHVVPYWRAEVRTPESVGASL